MSDPKRCQRCGGPLPEAGLLRGGCPRCMVELGLESASGFRNSEIILTAQEHTGVAVRHAVMGTELLHYRMESHLGSGGMGEVYQACDTRLERRVAIKILPEVFAQDAERVARFEREAKVLASLNHANIAALYGLEQADGRHFLVMELVGGETLADRIRRGPVPVEEALTIAHQITEALEAAHEKSVVHRDLKPANVKITPEGKVKVLDFGLAKAMEAAPGSTVAAGVPALSMTPGNAGVILGTPAYMAPEQAKGFAADPRSDIFALGCVLYEMLSGRPPFRGETLTDVIASVLARDPDLALLPPNLHPRIPELIRRCLVKEARNRWQAVADVRVEIESILPDPHGATVRLVGAERGPWWRRAIPVVVTAILAVAITAGIAWNRRPAPGASVARFSIVLPEGQQLTRFGRHNIALSPEGERIVYVANNQLYLRTIADVQARPIPGTDLDVDTPFFSPDGRWIGFYVFPEGKLKKIPVTGGASVTVADASHPFGASWGPDDRIVIGQADQGILRVSANGGRPETIVKVDKGEVAHGPQMLPDGEHILFTVTKGIGSTRWDQAQIVTQSLKSGERKVLIDGGSDARYVPTGHIVYALDSHLLAIPFDEKGLKRAGVPAPILENVMRSGPANTGAALFSFSNNGSMAYFVGSQQRSVARLAFTDGVGAKKFLPFPAGFYSNPRISPDGKQLVAAVQEESGNLWIYDLSGAASRRRLTFGGSNNFPIWTRDGQRIIYSSNRDGGGAIYWQRADGNGPAERLTEPKQRIVVASSLSQDGKTLAFNDNGGDPDIWMLHLDGDRKPQPLIEAKGSVQWRGSFSPDGRWIAYASDESKRQQIYVQPFPPTGAKWQITTNGGDSPLWSPDGKKLFYLEAQTGIYAQPGPAGSLYRLISVDVVTQAGFAFSNPTPLVEGMLMTDGPRPYDITPDGKQFVAVFPASDATSGEPSHPEIRVTLNWFTELQRRVPVK